MLVLDVVQSTSNYSSSPYNQSYPVVCAEQTMLFSELNYMYEQQNRPTTIISYPLGNYHKFQTSTFVVVSCQTFASGAVFNCKVNGYCVICLGNRMIVSDIHVFVCTFFVGFIVISR